MTADKTPDLRWDTAIYVYFDKPERMRALWRLRYSIPLPILRDLFAGVWVNMESHYQDMDIIKKLFDFCREGLGSRQLWMMTEDDKKKYNQLKMRRTSLTIYRGCWAENQNGWSWTTAHELAVRFAKRHAPDGWPLVIKGKAYIADVIAYIDERDEKEVVIRPEDVRDVKVERLEHQVPTTNALLFQAIQAGNFHSPQEEIERMMMTAQLQPERYLEFLRERLRFFELHEFTEKAALYREVEERIISSQLKTILKKEPI